MNHDPPESGTSPIETKPGANTAASDAMRMSHTHASERPAPAAGPLIAAMTGFSSARMARTFGWYVSSSRSRMSPVPRLELGQVLAGAEPAAGAREHDGSDVVVRPRLLERGMEGGVRRGVQGVEDLGAVERDRQHAAVARRQDLGHGLRLPRRACCVAPRASWRTSATHARACRRYRRRRGGGAVAPGFSGRQGQRRLRRRASAHPSRRPRAETICQPRTIRFGSTAGFHCTSPSLIT